MSLIDCIIICNNCLNTNKGEQFDILPLLGGGGGGGYNSYRKKSAHENPEKSILALKY